MTAMPRATVPHVCVIGHPIAHSRSPLIHGHWLATLGIAGHYDKQDVLPEAFAEFLTHLRAHGYAGANVTVPHKVAAHRLVGRRDGAAEAIGAVNTVWYEGDLLCGGNSDAHGFIESLDQSAPGWHVANARAVVLGAGGAAHAAAFALAARGIAVAVVNRTAERALATPCGSLGTALSEARFGPADRAEAAARRSRDELVRVLGFARSRERPATRLRSALSLRSFRPRLTPSAR